MEKKRARRVKAKVNKLTKEASHHKEKGLVSRQGPVSCAMNVEPTVPRKGKAKAPPTSHPTSSAKVKGEARERRKVRQETIVTKDQRANQRGREPSNFRHIRQNPKPVVRFGPGRMLMKVVAGPFASHHQCMLSLSSFAKT